METCKEKKKQFTFSQSEKFLLDSEKFNEWMEESDYDLEATAQKRRVTFQQETETKKSKEDLKPEDYKIPVVVPSHASWFNLDEIHDIEKRSLPEFFDSQSTTKTPEIYQQYRNFMVETFRKESDKYLSATECRKYLAGDISAIIRVFAFLEHWGLINYGVSSEKLLTPTETPVLMHEYSPSEKLVSLELPSFGVQPTYTVPIPKFTDKGDWSQEEVLRLLKAIEVNKDDWNKIAVAVGSRSKEECLSYFLKMPIEEEFMLDEPKINPDDPLPFGDSHNPIMQTVAFLASMVHPTVAASAAQAALQAFNNLETPNVVELSKLDTKTVCNAALGAAAAKAKLIAVKEEREIQRLVALILEKQMKKVEFKLKQLDHLEKLMNKERIQMEENKKKLEQEKTQFMAEKMNGKHDEKK